MYKITRRNFFGQQPRRCAVPTPLFSVPIRATFQPEFVLGPRPLFTHVNPMFTAHNTTALNHDSPVHAHVVHFQYGFSILPGEAHEKLYARRHVFLTELPELVVLVKQLPALVPSGGRLFALAGCFSLPSNQMAYPYVIRTETGFELNYIAGYEQVRKEDSILIKRP